MNVLVDNDNDGRAVIYQGAAGSGFNAITVAGTHFMGGEVKVVKPRFRDSK